MAYDGWVTYDGVEIFNISRVMNLASVLGIDSVWPNLSKVNWIDTALGDTDYHDITSAPWYDPHVPESTEFGGVLPLTIDGLDASTASSSVTEYNTDGGSVGRLRRETAPFVVSAALVATTDRGIEFGLRWLNSVLTRTSTMNSCSGVDMKYFQYAGVSSPQVFRRNVQLSRGVSVTKKHRGACSSTWTVTFTLTAGDPFEYGESHIAVDALGGNAPTGPHIIDSGVVALVESGCPVVDYAPIYDPLHPALIPPPTAPGFLPDGWGIAEGMTFDRFWVRTQSDNHGSLPHTLTTTLSSDVEARRVRVSVWRGDHDETEQCGALFSAVVSYVPGDVQFIIDGIQRASYVWDGFSPRVRRADSLVFSPTAGPLVWADVAGAGFLFTLDVFTESGDPEGDGSVRARIDMTTKAG